MQQPGWTAFSPGNITSLRKLFFHLFHEYPLQFVFSLWFCSLLDSQMHWIPTAAADIEWDLQVAALENQWIISVIIEGNAGILSPKFNHSIRDLEIFYQMLEGLK